jgi:outer membrane protein OmpA-like peptidoglycan-associated protein
MGVTQWLGMLSVFFCLGASAEAGESVRIYGRDEVPQADEIAGMLRAQKGSLEGKTARAKTRGISLDPAGTTSAESALAAQGQQAGAFAVQITFALDSAKVDPAFVPHLVAIAKGIELAGSDLKILIEGHTDASGSPQYNEALSLRRARVVRAMLIDSYGVASGKLTAVGKGTRELADAADPLSGKNRRVQFRVTE